MHATELIAFSMLQEDFLSTGIGDGGNEVGMGKAAKYLTAEAGSTIPSVEKIACTAATSFLIPCSVSNWGGYALSAALGVCANQERLAKLAPDTTLDPRATAAGQAAFISAFIGSEDLETAICGSMVRAGARDGVTVCLLSIVFDAALECWGILLQFYVPLCAGPSRNEYRWSSSCRER